MLLHIYDSSIFILRTPRPRPPLVLDVCPKYEGSPKGRLPSLAQRRSVLLRCVLPSTALLHCVLLSTVLLYIVYCSSASFHRVAPHSVLLHDVVCCSTVCFSPLCCCIVCFFPLCCSKECFAVLLHHCSKLTVAGAAVSNNSEA